MTDQQAQTSQQPESAALTSWVPIYDQDDIPHPFRPWDALYFIGLEVLQRHPKMMEITDPDTVAATGEAFAIGMRFGAVAFDAMAAAGEVTPEMLLQVICRRANISQRPGTITAEGMFDATEEAAS